MAKSIPARCSSLAVASVTRLFLSSKEPAQPTQYRYSWVKASPGSTISTPGTLSAQAPRSDCDIDHGLPEFSIAR